MKVDEIGQIIEESVRKVASPNEILPFLRLYVENRHLSLTNLLLVYQQDPDIRLVCGEKAWNRMGRNIKENAVSVQLILPEVRPGERENYRMVQGYGIDSTEGKEYRGNLKLPISSDQITEAAGKDYELVSEDPFVRIAVRLVVFEYFGMKHTIVKALFGRLNRMSMDEKYAFIKEMIEKSRNMLDKLDGCTLSFNETAFLNDLLVSANKSENVQILELAAQSTDNQEWREELANLREKLAKIKAGCLAELYQRKCQRRLFSFPPVRLEMETPDERNGRVQDE